jgi:hypothetical protein
VGATTGPVIVMTGRVSIVPPLTTLICPDTVTAENVIGNVIGNVRPPVVLGRPVVPVCRVVL